MRLKREAYNNTLARLYEYSTAAFAKRPFLNLLGSDCSYTYASFKQQTDNLSKLMTQFGIGAGDRVAILSTSQPNWAVAMFATVAFGRVWVPILPDSSESEVTNILNHSEAKAIFVSKKLAGKISEECASKLRLIIEVDTFNFIKKDDNSFMCDGVCREPMPDDLAAILYTSGTTGTAKGVMLSHRNFMGNVIGSIYHNKCHKSDVWLSVLPLAHTYELSIGLLYPMYVGASVNYMSKTPSPTALIATMKQVRPTVMLTVPLIIEKVYKSSIVPTIRKSKLLTWMDKHMHKTMCRLICGKLKKTFGGKIAFFGIGGAALDPNVEQFLKDGRFPYSIGYGTTECAPMVCASPLKKVWPGSIGYPWHNMEVRINNPDPETGVGEIVARGVDVMLGYYKDPERTKAAFTEDGWYRTKDLGIIDEKGRFFIKGRLNNMILGPSGENIYPEEIENVIAGVDGVSESIVVQRGGKLVALVQVDESLIDWDHEGEENFYEKLDAFRNGVMNFVNKQVKTSSKIGDVEVMKEPFEKTATTKIRRYKYSDEEKK